MDSIEQNKYNDILRQIISEIKSTRVVVARRVNSEMMQLYWSIGKRLSVEGLEKGYGSSVVKRLATDLQQEFPGTTGFSARNLWDMKRACKTITSKGMIKLMRVPCLPTGRHTIP